MEYKSIFKVWIAPNPMAVKMSDFMGRIGLGIDYVAVEEEYEVTFTKNPTKRIEEIKKAIVEAADKAGGQIYKIEHIETVKTLN